MYNGIKYDVFLAYRGNSEGGELASRLYLELKNYKIEHEKVFEPFFAPKTVKKGDNFKVASEKVIKSLNIMVMMLTKDFFANCLNDDDIVFHELKTALKNPNMNFVPIIMPGFDYKHEEEYLKNVFTLEEINRFKHISAINYYGIYDFNVERDLVPTLIRYKESEEKIKHLKEENCFILDNYRAGDGRIIRFGRYPQSIVSDISTMDALADGIFSRELEIDQRTKWISLNGKLYSVVKENPFNKTIFSSGKEISTGSRNYYLVEPIKWRVLYENEKNLILISDMLLDAVPFNFTREEHMLIDGNRIPANDWEHSNIRKWLNSEFYNVSFDDYDKKRILTSKIFNDTNTSYYKKYNAEPTFDNVFLASHLEIQRFKFGRAVTTDFARARGAYSSTSSSHSGNGDWWLRSQGNVSSSVENVDRRGVCDLMPFCNYVDDTSASVRPVIQIIK